MTVPFVHSGYERKENDDYQTIDERCVTALVESLNIYMGRYIGQYHKIVDICGLHGSGIVNTLVKKGFDAVYSDDAFSNDINCDWIVTNPPYDRKIVNSYVEHCFKLMDEKQVYAAAFLMRANWDMAQSRSHLFDNDKYHGQIRMRFRPWWSEERKAQPIHNYVWHIWTNGNNKFPTIYYWPKKEV